MFRTRSKKDTSAAVSAVWNADIHKFRYLMQWFQWNHSSKLIEQMRYRDYCGRAEAPTSLPAALGSDLSACLPAQHLFQCRECLRTSDRAHISDVVELPLYCRQLTGNGVLQQLPLRIARLKGQQKRFLVVR